VFDAEPYELADASDGARCDTAGRYPLIRRAVHAHDALVIDGLRKSFGVKGGTVETVKGISLRVAKGEVLGCLGPNGAGKTTTLRMLTTLLPPSATSVSRAAPTGTPPAARSSSSTASIGKHRAEAAATELIDLLQLAEFADRPALTYSGGQRRRLEDALLNPGSTQHVRLLLVQGDLPSAVRWTEDRGLDPCAEPNYYLREKS
jgi:ABC-type nitrate/sulfonate/bicarbonate transport system ATPase subunit